MPIIRFSAERRHDLHILGVTDEQIGALEAVLPSCKLLIQSGARLSDTRAALDKIIAALQTIKKAVNAKTTDAREALTRWQMAAHSRAHPFGSDPEFVGRVLRLDALIDAAREAKGRLGTNQRRSHAATPKPIWLIAEALVAGWQADTPTPPALPGVMPPRKFREIVQYAYEAIGALEDYVPERALRTYRDWRKKDAERLRQERDRLARERT